MSGTEAGDRSAFLATARRRLAGGVSLNPVHPPPPPAGDAVPRPGYRNLDPHDLLGTFAAAVEHAGGTCHVAGDRVPDDLLDRVAREVGDRPVVTSGEPDARDLGGSLAARGATVEGASVAGAARAGLGVTGAAAAVAATGSLMLDSRAVGTRWASLLPPVHLCVVRVNVLVPAPADVLRGLGSGADALPSSMVLVTGPSRTGDIEQLLTLGAHGPTALHVVVLTGGPGRASTSGAAPRA
ncbi:MAG TPA: LUD domain-containing protein [Acidimicrobiales bacterium]